MSFSLRAPSRWKRWLQGWQKVDGALLVAPILLTLFASVVITSTQVNLGETSYGWNHLLLGGFSVVIALGLARFRYENLLEWRC
jgi:rod shape determining protein RodA